MRERFPLNRTLPDEAVPAIRVAQALAKAGHAALLAGGCVRDLLLGAAPQDYDVATDARPERVSALFKTTRHVGAQFGVVLVRSGKRWIEVATFRADGTYSDGRRPDQVTFGDAQLDAQRRDFTINGMFLDPQRLEVIDFVGGAADLRARVVRAIGDPAERFAEDHLRLLRAVRFAARLEFAIEPRTAAAIRAAAPFLARVSAERVREELERMLAQEGRSRAFELLSGVGLLTHLWPGAWWSDGQRAAVAAALAGLPPRVSFALGFAQLVCDRRPEEIERIGRALTFSNVDRETVLWLVEHQADLDDPSGIALAALKRLMAHEAFADLLEHARVRNAKRPNAGARTAALQHRLAAVDPALVRPPPFVTGDDLLAAGVPQGPQFKHILDELYTRQLDETLATREAALAALRALLG
ncbi:MAG: Poly(A) polymerase I [Phycisphaerae bacterium]|nr:Poly(A) polymerase I [Phycisphaerae bacterium]